MKARMTFRDFCAGFMSPMNPTGWVLFAANAVFYALCSVGYKAMGSMFGKGDASDDAIYALVGKITDWVFAGLNWIILGVVCWLSWMIARRIAEARGPDRLES